MPKIFFCYRRDDSTHPAGRIFDHLASQFGKNALFKDVDSMPIGLDYRRVLADQVAACDVLLAIIGDDWLSVTDAAGHRRLDNPGDFVRIEIETALKRDIPVIPVLVGRRAGAHMPKAEDLPDSLQELAYRHCLAIRADPDFHTDVERLIRGIHDTLGRVAPGSDSSWDITKSGHAVWVSEKAQSYLRDKVLKDDPPEEPPASAPPPAMAPARGRRRRWPWVAAAAALVLVIVAVAVALVAGGKKPDAEDPLVEATRIRIRREVESVRKMPTELLKENTAIQWDDALEPPSYPAFEILSDSRVVDLREWKPVGASAERFASGATMHRRLRMRKLRPVDDVKFEFRTQGTDLFVDCPSHREGSKVLGQRGDGLVAGKRVRVRQLVVDVSKLPVNHEFDVRTVATYWNSLKADEDLWFGAMGYENSFKVSLLLIFPDAKPFTDFRMMVQPTREGKPQPFAGEKVLLSGERRDWVYWEIPEPKDGHVYSLYWSW